MNRSKTLLTAGNRLILTYLIPCHLITTHTLPSEQLLEPYPRLQKLFLPLSRCIKKGELHAFDLALQEGEAEFVKRRIYLTLERGRDIALRNLLRKVFIAGGFDDPKEPGAAPLRRTRVPIDEFVAAISLGSQDAIEQDEVECLLANMIYKVSRNIPSSPSSVFADPALRNCPTEQLWHAEGMCHPRGSKAASRWPGIKGARK